MAQRATKEQVKNFRPSVKGRSFKHDGPRSRKSKTLDRSPHDGQKNNQKTSQKLWFDQTTWCHSFDKGGPKSHQRTSRCQGCTFLQEIIIPGKIYCRSFTGEILLQNLYIVGKNTAVVLLEKFYRRIFSGKNTAVVLLEKFYCRIFSGKNLLLKSSCWKICLKIFNGKICAAEF